MGRYGQLWGAMGQLWGSYGALWGAMGQLWGAMGQLWGPMGRYGAAMGCCGALWALWGSYGALWGAMGQLWGAMGQLWGSYGALWGAMGQLWGAMGRCGARREPQLEANGRAALACVGLAAGTGPGAMMQLKVTALLSARLCETLSQRAEEPGSELSVERVMAALGGEAPAFSCLSAADNAQLGAALQRLDGVAADAVGDLGAVLSRAQRLGACVGLKLVRGAYLQHERARGAALPSRQHTDRSYEQCLELALARAARAGGRLELMVATHNEGSVQLAVRRMEELGLPRDGAVCFGQLLGMCDHCLAGAWPGGFPGVQVGAVRAGRGGAALPGAAGAGEPGDAGGRPPRAGSCWPGSCAAACCPGPPAEGGNGGKSGEIWGKNGRKRGRGGGGGGRARRSLSAQDGGGASRPKGREARGRGLREGGVAAGERPAFAPLPGGSQSARCPPARRHGDRAAPPPPPPQSPW
ncbi:uncharacterized protein [Anser cygnoides]|uniref:uncharacterized protein isoform X2 n=1 Tax=Anser cygnoides TaxID=8845 RepID=UPI0034D35D8F